MFSNNSYVFLSAKAIEKRIKTVNHFLTTNACSICEQLQPFLCLWLAFAMGTVLIDTCIR